MDHLPNKIALKILQKCEPSVHFKLKYHNKRMSALVMKNLNMDFELKEVTIETKDLKNKTAKVVWPDDEIALSVTSFQLSQEETNFVFTLSAKSSVCGRMKFVGGILIDRSILSMQNLRYIDNLELVGVEMDAFALANVLDKYNVRKCTLDNVTERQHWSINLSLWKKIIECGTIMTKLQIKTSPLNDKRVLDEHFLALLRAQKIPNINLNGCEIRFETLEFLDILEEAILTNCSIDWSIIPDKPWLSHQTLQQFAQRVSRKASNVTNGQESSDNKLEVRFCTEKLYADNGTPYIAQQILSANGRFKFTVPVNEANNELKDSGLLKVTSITNHDVRKRKAASE